MNRCTQAPTARTAAWRTALTTALLGLLCLSVSAQESVRPFPAAARRATLQITYPPDILLNGKAARLSPGARIHGTNNMLVLSGTLAGQSLMVNYVLNPQGQVHEVWVLNATEARQPMEGASLPPNYVSDAATASGEAGTSASAAATSTSQ